MIDEPINCNTITIAVKIPPIASLSDGSLLIFLLFAIIKLLSLLPLYGSEKFHGCNALKIFMGCALRGNTTVKQTLGIVILRKTL